MKKALLLLFVAFSLLLAPIAHAFDANCEDNNCRMSEQVKKEPKSEKQQDNDKMLNGGHHCCCIHLSSLPDLTVASPLAVSSRTAFTLEQDAMSSVMAGPPLKPPSRA